MIWSLTVSLTVNKPPLVSITAPTNTATFTAPASLTLAATAIDLDGTVARVDFHQGATLLGGATAAPYTLTWRRVIPGSYTITARATDNLGGTTISAPITVIVKSFMDGLVAFYPFNGDASDPTGDGNDGTLIGSDWQYCLDRFGQPSSLSLNTTSTPALTLDGSYVAVPKDPMLDFNQDFTVSLWVSIPNGVQGWYVHNFVSDGPDTTSANLRLVSGADASGMDYLQFVCNHQDGDIHSFVQALRDEWWQVAVVRSGASVSLFRNGVLLTGSTVTSVVTNSPTMWLGRHICPGYPDNCPGSYPLVGGIDDVRMFNRALSAQEVLQLYNYERGTLPALSIAAAPPELRLFAAEGTTSQIESSTDLQIWMPFGTPVPATNWIISQPLEIVLPQQYFRVRQIP